MSTPTARNTASSSGNNTPRYLCDGVPGEIGELIQSLLTKDDIRTMVDNFRRPTVINCKTWGELGHLTTRVDSSVILAEVEARLEWMEQAQADTEVQLTELQLLLED